MKAKYIFYTGAVLIIIALFTHCKKESKAPEAIVVSNEKVTLEKGKSEEVTISKGKSPFTVSSASQTIATVNISGNTITISGIAEGETKVDITSADNAKKQITVTVNPIFATTINHEVFKTNNSLLFEFRAGTPNSELIRNGIDKLHLMFIKDAGQLFSSTKNKVGYCTKDGLSLMLIEWEGDTSVGEKSNASIRTLSGVTTLRYFEVLKFQDGIIWAVYQEESGVVGRFRQKW